MFKKIALMNGKCKFSKTKGSICNIPVEAVNDNKTCPTERSSKHAQNYIK